MFSYQISERHKLQMLEPHNAEELFSLCEKNRAYLRGNLPWLDSTQSPADTLSFIQSSLHRFANGKGVNLGIWVDNALVGIIGHAHIDWINRIATIGYWLAEAHQGKGIITSSCRAVIDDAFNTLKVNKVVITCASGNLRSRAVPERLQFVHEGTLREAVWLYDHFINLEVYGCMQREWAHFTSAEPKA